MTHLSEEKVIDYIFQANALNTEEITHLTTCDTCRRSVERLREMANEMRIHQQSTPAAESLESYYQLFKSVEVRETPIAQAVKWLRAMLTWDSRQQLSFQGVRSGVSTSYRLLFNCELADVEVMVESRNGSRRVEGEIMALDDALQLPALIQLSELESGDVREIESNGEGRFQIAGMKPGVYQLFITPKQGDSFELEPMQIS